MKETIQIQFLPNLRSKHYKTTLINLNSPILKSCPQFH